MTALSTGELESDDDIEKEIIPKRPGPTSSPRQTAAAVAKDGQEVPKQPAAASPAVSALSNTTKNTQNKDRFVFIMSCILFVTCLFTVLHIRTYVARHIERYIE